MTGMPSRGFGIRCLMRPLRLALRVSWSLPDLPMPGAIAMKSQNIPETIGSTLLAILPDTGERYITTRLWGR